MNLRRGCMRPRIYKIYGYNNARSVLQSSSCTVHDIFLDNKSKYYQDIKKIIFDNNSSTKIRKIQSYKSTKNDAFIKRSQGMIVSFTFNGIVESISSFFNTQTKNDCILILDQLEDPQNLGQILRTAECAGVKKIILPINKSVKLSDSVMQVSQGAFCNLQFFICNNLRNTIRALKENDFWIVALENTTKSKNWYDIDLSGNIAIILGSEGKGVRRLTLDDSDFVAKIPMMGKLNSLNVSAACSTILFERLRQISVHGN